MTLLLSVPDFLTQHSELAEQWQSVRQPLTIPLQDACGKSQGYRQEVNLRPGLNVLIDDYTLQEDLLIETCGWVARQPWLVIEMRLYALRPQSFGRSTGPS